MRVRAAIALACALTLRRGAALRGEAAEDATELRILTWNVWDQQDSDRAGHPWATRKRLIADEVGALQLGYRPRGCREGRRSGREACADTASGPDHADGRRCGGPAGDSPPHRPQTSAVWLCRHVCGPAGPAAPVRGGVPHGASSSRRHPAHGRPLLAPLRAYLNSNHAHSTGTAVGGVGHRGGPGPLLPHAGGRLARGAPPMGGRPARTGGRQPPHLREGAAVPERLLLQLLPDPLLLRRTGAARQRTGGDAICQAIRSAAGSPQPQL